MRKSVFILVLFFLRLSAAEKAYAYADPGVGGTLYQVVILILSGIGVFFIALKTKLLSLFRRRKKK